MCYPSCGSMFLGLKNEEKNPKVVDKSRQNILIISTNEMQRYKDMMDPGRRERETAQYYRAYSKYIKQGSGAIEEQWPDSINKIATRTLEIRKADLERRALEHAERKAKIDEAREKKHRDAVFAAEKFLAMLAPGPTELRNASIECYTKAEQDAQIKFKEARKAEAKVKYDEEVKAMWDDVEAYKNEELEKARKNREKTQKIVNRIMEEIEVKEKQRKDEYWTTYNNGIKDRELAEEEYQAILKEENDKKKERFALLIKNTEEGAKDMEKREQNREKYEMQLNKLNETILCTQEKIERKIREKQKDIINTRMDEINLFAERVILAAANDAEAREDALVERLTREKAEREDAVAAAKAQKVKDDQIKANEDHDKCLAEIAQDEADAFQLSVWNKLNSTKQLEIMEEFKRRNKERLTKNNVKRIEELLVQSRKDEEARERRRQYDEDLSRNREMKIEKDDEIYFKYANQLLNELKQKEYIVRPVENTIHKYKVINRLYIKEQNAAKKAGQDTQSKNSAGQGSSTQDPRNKNGNNRQTTGKVNTCCCKK